MIDSSLPLKLLIHAAVARLAPVDIDAPRLTTEVILAHVLDVDRAQLLARLDERLTSDQFDRFQTDLQRILQGEPLAYVVGHREFYDLDLLTDKRALIPRPETECLIEEALKLFAACPALLIADIGTGCGAIGVTLAKHLPQARVIVSDLSAEAIELARSNAQRHAVIDRIEFRTGSLLEPIHEPIDLLTANLPYIDDKDWPYLAKTIRGHEPRMAFIGGPNGLDLIRQLLQAAPRVMKPGGVILLEIGAYQGEDVSAIAAQAFPSARISVKPDYAGLDRLVVIQL
jgi:release factor glutamine methyltransferase